LPVDRSTIAAPSVVAIAGRIASGKTTVAQELSVRVGCPYASFGAYVRVVAHRRGLNSDRPALQQLGEQLIAEGWTQFVEGVVASAGGEQDCR